MSSPVSVIIPTHNGRHLLQQHLTSVENMMRSSDELIIVDDASTDDTLNWLKKRYTASQVGPTRFSGSFSKGSHSVKVLILALTQNGRFAKAVNTAVEHTASPTFLLLNNDVEPDSQLLTTLVPLFFDNRVFGVGCHEYEDEARTIEGGKNRLWFERGIFQHARATEFSTGETAWVSGGSGMFDTNKWHILGGFDEEYYPAYWEDTDLSFRARKNGWKTLFCAEAVVLHQHETSNKSEFGQSNIRKLSWEHQKYFTRKHADAWQLLQYYIWQPYWWWKMQK